MKHEKEVELEIIKTLRKNWVPPEDSNVEVAQTKLEPKKLQIAHVYGNDSRDGPEKYKQQRENELQEVRQSAPLGARWMPEDTAVNVKHKNELLIECLHRMKIGQGQDLL